MDLSNNTKLNGLTLNGNQLVSAPIGISNIINTEANIDIVSNPLDENARAELEILQQTYSRLVF